MSIEAGHDKVLEAAPPEPGMQKPSTTKRTKALSRIPVPATISAAPALSSASGGSVESQPVISQGTHPGHHAGRNQEEDQAARRAAGAGHAPIGCQAVLSSVTASRRLSASAVATSYDRVGAAPRPRVTPLTPAGRPGRATASPTPRRSRSRPRWPASAAVSSSAARQQVHHPARHIRHAQHLAKIEPAQWRRLQHHSDDGVARRERRGQLGDQAEQLRLVGRHDADDAGRLGQWRTTGTAPPPG